MTWWMWIACGAIGALGALMRAEVVAIATARLGSAFPWGTLAANLTGAFALGALHGAAVGGWALIMSGAALLGAYTTFSTWMLETIRLWRTSPAAAAANIIGASCAGVALAWLGDLSARSFS